ncbi:MAG: efflux RND transporter permease subunit, partial [Pigmentiphaga sp.]
MSSSRFNLSAWSLAHQPLMRYLIVVMLLAGAWAYQGLGQDEDPPFTFKVMVVQANWPGATASEMAEQVSDRIERALQRVPWADKIISYTQPGTSVTILNLDGAAPAAEVPHLWYMARKQVGDIAATLPEGVIGPRFNDDFGDTYGVIYAFVGDGFDAAALRDYADLARQELLKTPDVAKIDLFGLQDERIHIEISGQRLAQLGLTLADIAAPLEAQNAVQASGVLTLPNDQLQVRVSGALGNLDDLRLMPIRVPPRMLPTGEVVGGSTVRLGEIAQLSRSYVDPPLSKMRVGSAAGASEVIGLGVVMRKGGNILALGESLDQEQARIQAGLPVGVDFIKVADQPRAVERSIGEFVKVLVEAVVI